MSAAIPYARILAETAAWPFWAQCAFEGGIIHLSRHPSGALDEPTALIADALKTHLQLRAGGTSLDSLRQVRDFVWFRSEAHECVRPLSGILYEVAQSYFEVYGDGRLKLKISDITRDPETHELSHRLRYLGLALPLDLLTASLGSTCSLPEILFPSQATEGRAFEEFLNEGIVEIHNHLTACLRFEALWTYLMTSTGSPKISVKDLDEKDIPFGNTEKFLSWLATAGLARLTMAEYLARRGRSTIGVDQSFRSFVERSLRGEPNSQSEHRRTLVSFAIGREPTSLHLVRMLYSQFVDDRTQVKDLPSLKHLRERDPLAEMLTVDTTKVWPESRLCCESLHYLRDNGHSDYSFAQVFWQYHRIRCMTYRYLTQEPGIAGLDWFVRFFHRLSPLRRGLDERVLMTSAIEMHQGRPSSEFPQPSWLQTLEVRIAPKHRWNKLLESLEKTAPCPDETPSSLKVGVIIHFKKAGLETTQTIARPGAQNGNGLEFVRYGSYYRNWRSEATSIKDILRLQPSLLRRLRGLDICGQELSTPLWPLLPLLGELRQVSRDIANDVVSNPCRQFEPLRITLHAGEDFRTPLEGLRRIHEPIEFGLLEAADRVGHAIALGINISEWARSCPVAWQPREERLDDLLWLLEWVEKLKVHRSSSSRQHLERKACALAGTIYGSSVLGSLESSELLTTLMLARRLRHAPEILRAWNYPLLDCLPREPSQIENLLILYLTDLGVFRRGITPIEVVMDKEEANLIERAQVFLRNKLASMCLTIEVNPSSNLLIAELGGLDQHPAFRLCPLKSETFWGKISDRVIRLIQKWHISLPSNLCEPQLRVALCTDDPLTFATSLPEEIAYIYHALRRRGASEKDAIRWLRDRQKDAKDGIFAIEYAPSWMGN
ncbi:MAG: hypothetical protein U1A78_30860 [Polyangia bacterium]